jgi:hypothetical protein
MAQKVGCLRHGVARMVTFSVHYVQDAYWLTALNDSIEFATAYSEVDLERHAIIQPI